MSLLRILRGTNPNLRRYVTSVCGCRTSISYVQKHAFTIMYGQNGNPPDVLVGKDVPVGQPRGGQVLVKMVAAPINPADINLIQGVYAIKANLPAVPGSEGVGVVEAVGPDVKNHRVGDHVVPLAMNLGTWRTHLLSDCTNFNVVDKNLPFPAAATLLVNPGTAYRMLKDFGTKAGDTVIQNGANSAVGQAIIQIAKKFGIKTVNIVRDRDDFKDVADYLSCLGADHILSESELRKPEVKDLWKSRLAQPKLAIDCVAGKSATELMRHLCPGGVLMNYGGMSKQPLIAPVSALIFKEISIRGFWFSQWRERSPESEVGHMMNELVEMTIRGELLAPRHELVQIADFQEAIRKSMTPFVSRKQILVMDNHLL